MWVFYHSKHHWAVRITADRQINLTGLDIFCSIVPQEDSEESENQNHCCCWQQSTISPTPNHLCLLAKKINVYNKCIIIIIIYILKENVPKKMMLQVSME